MQVQRCTCTHLGVHHHTNVSSARMHPPAGRLAMQVGVEWNAGRNAGLLPAGRTVHYRVTNSSLQRVGLAISTSFLSLSLFLHPFFLYSRGFLHVLVEWRQRHGPNEGVSFLPRHLTKNESLCHLDDQIHSTIIRQPRGSIDSMIRDDVGIWLIW